MAGSKQQVLYIHGGESFQNYDDYLRRLKTKEIRNLPDTEQKVLWSKHFVEDLGADFEVFALSMPNSNNARYTEWKLWFERYVEYLRDEVILVGWSLGAIFFLKYFSEEELSCKVKSLMLLAPASYPFTDPKTGEDGGDFNFDQGKLAVIPNKVNNIISFHSKDDFVIPYDHSEKLKELVPELELVSFEDKNHFIIEEFPELIAKIKALT